MLVHLLNLFPLIERSHCDGSDFQEVVILRRTEGGANQEGEEVDNTLTISISCSLSLSPLHVKERVL